MGNVLLASGIVSYFGPFTLQFREKILAEWIEKFDSYNIQLSENPTLNMILGKLKALLVYQVT